MVCTKIMHLQPIDSLSLSLPKWPQRDPCVILARLAIKLINTLSRKSIDYVRENWKARMIRVLETRRRIYFYKDKNSWISNIVKNIRHLAPVANWQLVSQVHLNNYVRSWDRSVETVTKYNCHENFRDIFVGPSFTFENIHFVQSNTLHAAQV